jgi:hypothetical protein
MRSIPDMLDALGGSAVVAAKRKLPYTTVASWKARGAIPAREWPGLVELAREMRVAGFTLQKLADLHAATRKARAA